MSKPRKLSLASIVAAASPPAAVKSPSGKTAEIVHLDLEATSPRGAATLKQRAKQMSVYLEPPVYEQLRELAFSERTKMHGLMLEALDLLFKQRGAKSIDQLIDEEGR